jgi:glycosyltransferase involved in cell wall biosynthesis
MVGGIFDKPAAYRHEHVHTPETTLADGLSSLGHRVVCVGHRSFIPSDDHDVVHVHHAGRAAYVMAVAKTRARFVFTGHDGQLLCGSERRVGRAWAFRQVLRRCDGAVALSAVEEAHLRAAGARTVAVIPNGIHLDYASTAPAAPPRRSGVLYVGQLIPLKGVDVLLRAMTRDVVPATAELSLVYQNDALEETLRKLAGKLEISHRVKFIGPLPPDRLARLYAEAEVLALPSRAEALPSVISEAMLAGTSVVASRVGGIPDQLGEWGEVVPPGDVDALAGALGRALRSPPTEARREACRSRARRLFDPEAMVRSHERLYASLLQGGPRPREEPLLRAAARALLRLYPTR